MKRDASLDVARCVLNYMIVLLHAWAAFQYVDCSTIEFKFWTFICHPLCGLALPCFFMISGYLLFRGFSIAKWPSKMSRRMRRLAVPYVAWNLFFVVFYLAAARVVSRLAKRVATFGLDTVGGAFSKVLSLTVPPIDGPLWFLRTVFLLSLISPILYGLMRVRRGVLALILALAWVAIAPFCDFAIQLNATIPAYAIACFVLGGVVAVRDADLSTYFRATWWIVFGIGVWAVRTSVSMADVTLPICVKCALSVLGILEAPALIALAVQLPNEKLLGNGIFRYFKDMSFFAYAGHFLFCSMILHSLAPLFPGMFVGKMTLLVFLFFVLGLTLISLSYSLGRRYFPRTLKVFDGTL